MRRRHALPLWAICFFALSCFGAELRIRKEVIETQANRATITTPATFDHVKAVNTLGKDCDLHAPVHAKSLHVAVVSEFMNACAGGMSPQEVIGWSAEGPTDITGVFRLWFEHPGKKGEDTLSEEDGPPEYKNSNPPHAIEIHPLVQVGTHSFYDKLGPIKQGGTFFKAKTATQLVSLLKRKVTIQEYDGEDGDQYVSIQSGCCLANYFKLTAVLRTLPKKTDDGHSAMVDVMSGQKVVAKGLRVFSVSQTVADNNFKGMKVNDRFTFWGITRMDLSKAIAALEEDSGAPIKIPVEFVLLDAR
jgi:hypothetical protein